MSAYKKILVVGELNLDLILNRINGFPVIGHEIMAGEMNLVLGSSSAIFASNISQLGNPVAFCGMVGNDSFGDTAIGELKKRHIDTAFITVSDNYKTGVTVVMNYEQDRANVTFGGAMEMFSKEDIPIAQLSEFDHLHLSSFFLLKKLKPHITELFRSAKDNGLTTSLDTQWDPDNQWQFPYESCLPFVDVFLPNESELLLLSEKAELNAALAKIGEFAQMVVVKRGTQGSMAYLKGALTHSKPFLHQSFVDAIGAGDSFNAGFLFRYLQGRSLDACLRFGNLCGAINTTAAGGTAAFDYPGRLQQQVKTLFNTDLDL